MSTETITQQTPRRGLRIDAASDPKIAATMRPAVALRLVATIAVAFVLLGGGSLEPTDAEARLALSAHEPISAVAQVLGGYDPSITPGAAWITAIWTAVFDGSVPSTGSIRWPAVLAAIALGLLLARRVGAAFGPRAAVFAAIASFGSVALIDRSATTRMDLLTALALVATLDRLLARGSDWVAGSLAAVAAIVGGWPALAAVLLTSIVIGRKNASPSVRLLLPPIAIFAAWSVWAIMTTRAEVWAAVVMLPLKQTESWKFGLWAIAAALPFAPLAVLAAVPSFRAGWDQAGRGMVSDWAKVAGVGLLAGTLMPGMAAVGVAMMFAGLVIGVAPVLDRMWATRLDGGARRTAAGLSLMLGIVTGATAVYAGAYLAAGQPYYRVAGIALIVLGTLAALFALDSAWTGSTRGSVRALVLVALIVKVAYSGYYMPEMNYRFSKGPWGRAVGQHVPPGKTIYTFHDVSPALALATEHPVHRLREEIFLKVQPGSGPKFVLLQEAEFSHWPEIAPKIQKVRAFQDEYGGIRILARTEGPLTRRDVD
jgi:hypothetical protein